MKKVKVTFTVHCPDRLTNRRIAELIGRMVAIGMDDAYETLDEKSFEWSTDKSDAQAATELRISKPKVTTTPHSTNVGSYTEIGRDEAIKNAISLIRKRIQSQNKRKIK